MVGFDVSKVQSPQTPGKRLKCPYCDSAMLQFMENEEQLHHHILIAHGHSVPKTITDHSDPEMDKLVREKARAFLEWQRDSVVKVAKDAEELRQLEQESLKKTFDALICRHCGHHNYGGLTTCPNCGAGL